MPITLPKHSFICPVLLPVPDLVPDSSFSICQITPLLSFIDTIFVFSVGQMAVSPSSCYYFSFFSYCFSKSA